MYSRDAEKDFRRESIGKFSDFSKE